ncbi:MAG: DUF1489 family protein, partial [Rhodospirillales bacterium]|nr:DUF1489 family protein [Rhodospirillales bacterium]
MRVASRTPRRRVFKLRDHFMPGRLSALSRPPYAAVQHELQPRGAGCSRVGLAPRPPAGHDAGYDRVRDRVGMVHLTKLAVGIRDIEHLRQMQAERLRSDPPLRHRTRAFPRRREEI